jgi:hypothetical protein
MFEISILLSREVIETGNYTKVKYGETFYTSTSAQFSVTSFLIDAENKMFPSQKHCKVS